MSRHFDAASGLPLGASARRALESALDRGWADPARLHRDGRVARQLLDAARASVADRIGALPQEVSFTSSGTAALHLAVLGLARGRSRVGRGVVVGAVEHSAVLRAADWVAEAGEPVTIGVDSHAEVEVEAFAAALDSPGVALACLQHANHEVGTLQPLQAVHAACRAAGVPLVVDACASLGSIPAPSDWDVLAGSAHKWGGPAGVGILAIRTGTRWRSPVPTDEAGRPAGFPDVPGAVAAATALEEATSALARTQSLRHRLVARLRAEVPRCAPDVLVLGPESGRLPHLVGFTVLYADGEALVGALDRAGFAVASGSACTADTRRPSHVLAAMGAVTHGNLRVSLPPEVTDGDVEAFLAALPGAIEVARAAGDRAAGPRAAQP
jgi:cysteine desulfurase